MESLHTIKIGGRACCAIKDEVWVAKQSGGVAVYSARTGAPLSDVTIAGKDLATAQVTRMIAVFDEVWLATNAGEVCFVNATRHACVDTLRIPGAEKKVQIVGLCFNGHVAVIAAASGSLFLHHPLSHRRLATLSTPTAPCTAVAQLYSFVVGGDAAGGLYVWDAHSAACITYHGESTSGVCALLHEPTTGTVWVARKNENVDVYALDTSSISSDSGTGLCLQRRVSGLGKVTDLVAVSGTVLATTFAGGVVQIDAQTAKIIAKAGAADVPAPSSPTTADAAVAHASFVHGCCKAMHQEVAQVWTVGNDSTVRVWRATGKHIPVVPVPLLPPAVQAQLANAVEAAASSVESELRVEVQTARQQRVDIVDDLRKSREEAQELRLRLAKREASVHIVEEELAAETKLRKELEERLAKLTKDVTEITSKVNTVERERGALQSEVTQLKTDVSKANTNANTRQAEKATAEQQLAQEKTSKCTLEQRLRDTENKLTALQAEHRRLCESTGTTVSATALSKEAQDNLAKNSATMLSDLEQARRLNQLMSSAIASMEYTIRRHEEEHKDLTALLNAYRRRVADRVSDPHLSALLLATIVRNAPRFDLECDAFTKAQLMDRNGPFLLFVQSLRTSDPEAYEKLIQYLQNPSATENLTAEAQTMLDRFVSLAAKEGDVSGEDLASFKRSIPSLVTSSGGAAAAPAPATSNAPAVGGSGAAPGSLAALLQNNLLSSAKPNASGIAADGANADANANSSGLSKQDQEVVNRAVITELRGQQGVDENFIREQQAMFEFILRTRRLLVESLAVLHKRTVSARQVVEALSVNAATSTAALPGIAAPRKSLQPLQGVFGGIIKELDSLATEVVTRYLTAAEKQRLGISSS